MSDDNDDRGDYISTDEELPGSAGEKNIVGVHRFDNACVVVSRRYTKGDFAVVGVMVFHGSCDAFGATKHAHNPRFTRDSSSPLALFRPDDDGVRAAIRYAESLSERLT